MSDLVGSGGDDDGDDSPHDSDRSSQRDLVKRRMLQLRQDERSKHQDALLAKAARARVRELAELDAERAALWAKIVHAVLSAQAWPAESVKATRLGKLRAAYYPLVLVKVRRWIRQCRAKLALPLVARPTVQALKGDKMLGLFPDSRLRHLIETATLKYYFQDETIVFKGCRDEEECYFVVSGCVEQQGQGGIVTAAFEPGTFFGSVGMLSGEPRPATVVVRGAQGALVWVLHRSDIEAFEMLPTNDKNSATIAQATTECSSGRPSQNPRRRTVRQVVAARTMVNDLREEDLHNAYEALLEPMYWVRNFPVFAGVSPNFVESILSRATPCVRKHGATLCSAVASQFQPSVPLTLVVRGRLTIYLARGARVLNGVQAGELLAMSLEGPGLRKVGTSRKTHREELTDALARHLAQIPSLAGPAGAIAHDVLLGEAEGPVLISAPLGALGEAGWLRVEVGFRGVDAFQIARSALYQDDLLELDTMRRNALAMHSAFMVPPTGKQVQRALFASVVPSLPVLRLLQKQHLSLASCPLRPVALRAGDVLRSGGSGRDDVYFVVSGELDVVVLHPAVPTQQTPALWPELPLVYLRASAVRRTPKHASTHLCAHAPSWQR